MDFGNILKKIRQDNNLTQEELAKKIDTSRSNIANYENNKNMPSIDILDKLSKIFNVSTDYLLGKSDIRNYSDIKKLNVQDFAVNNSNYDNNKYDIGKLDVPANSFGMMKFYESMKRIQEFQNADLSEKDATDIANLLDAIVPFIDKKADKTDEKWKGMIKSKIDKLKVKEVIIWWKN